MEKDPLVFDAGEAGFAQDVVARSQSAVVLVDFWADWCQPCKVLGPILEQLAGEAGGTLAIAKVDTEKEPRLASLFQVQSIPFVVAFVKGKPVDAFAGALPEDQVRAFCEKHGVQFGAQEPEDEGEAEDPFGKVIAEVREGIAGRPMPNLSERIDGLEEIEEDEENYSDAQRLLAAASFLRGEIPDGSPLSDRLAMARALWLERGVAAAGDALLDCIAEDASWQEGLARKTLVALFVIHQEEHEVVSALRRRLAVLIH